MTCNHFRFAFALSLLAACIAAPARGGTVSSTQGFGVQPIFGGGNDSVVVTFAPFDTSLGILVEARFSGSVTLDGEAFWGFGRDGSEPEFVSIGNSATLDLTASADILGLGPIFFVGDADTGFVEIPPFSEQSDTLLLSVNKTDVFDVSFGDSAFFQGGPVEVLVFATDTHIGRPGPGAFGNVAPGAIDAFGDITLTYVYQPFGPPPSAVPEPGSLTLLGLGSLGLVAFRRRRSTLVADEATPE